MYFSLNIVIRVCVHAVNAVNAVNAVGWRQDVPSLATDHTLKFLIIMELIPFIIILLPGTERPVSAPFH
jgi:hypothetical protein